jgi:hypothetical protein
MVFVRTHEERYWLLANALWMASGHDGDDEAMGRYNALKTACEDAIAFPIDTAISLIEGRGKGIAPEMTGVPDPYRDGYVAGCERAVTIMRGEGL